MNDTIAAISTPSGQGAMAIVRLSGPDSFKIIQSIFQISISGRPILIKGPKDLHHGWIKSGKQLVDEVMVSHYTAPKTYTGEDIVEISCHGSTFIQQETVPAIAIVDESAPAD